jgi:hypothetical protein
MTSQQEVSGWAVGWTAFAGTLMIIMGFFHAITGLVAVLEDDLIVITPDYIFQFSVTTWGWIHLVAGIIVLLAGFYLFTGAVWARVIGVIIVAVSMVANFAWLPYRPVWSVILIAAGGFVIWALTAHGRDVTAGV